MKLSIHPRIYQAIGVAGMVLATVLGIWLLGTGRSEGNQLLTNLGYGVAFLGALTMILVVKPPLRPQDI